MLWAGRQLSHSEGLITIGGAASCSSEKYPSASISKTHVPSHISTFIWYFIRKTLGEVNAINTRFDIKALTFYKWNIAWAILSPEMHSCILYIFWIHGFFVGHCPLTKLSYPSPIYVVKNLEFLYKNLQYQHFSKIMDQRLIWVFFFPIGIEYLSKGYKKVDRNYW